MSDETTAPAPEAAPAAPVSELDAFAAEMKRILADVSRNPAKVEFPRDTWGMTTELRKAGLRAASSIRGNEAKQRVFLGTLQVLAAHVKARLEDDKAELEARLAARTVSVFNDRAYGTPVPAPAAEDAVPVE